MLYVDYHSFFFTHTPDGRGEGENVRSLVGCEFTARLMPCNKLSCAPVSARVDLVLDFEVSHGIICAVQRHPVSPCARPEF